MKSGKLLENSDQIGVRLWPGFRENEAHRLARNSSLIGPTK